MLNLTFLASHSRGAAPAGVGRRSRRMPGTASCQVVADYPGLPRSPAANDRTKLQLPRTSGDSVWWAPPATSALGEVRAWSAAGQAHLVEVDRHGPVGVEREVLGLVCVDGRAVRTGQLDRERERVVRIPDVEPNILL